MVKEDAVRVEIWSDLVCPWCYLGKHRFERALAGFEHRDDVEVVHHSFQLDPSFPRGESQPTHEILAERYGMTLEQADATAAQMEQRAAEAGLDASEARAVLASDTYKAEVEADGRRARELGATGVPFFVLDNRYGVAGAQSTDVFTGVLERAWSERSAPCGAGSTGPT